MHGEININKCLGLCLQPLILYESINGALLDGIITDNEEAREHHVTLETKRVPWYGNTQIPSKTKVQSSYLWCKITAMFSWEAKSVPWADFFHRGEIINVQCCSLLQGGHTERSCSKKRRLDGSKRRHHPPWQCDTPHSPDDQTVVWTVQMGSVEASTKRSRPGTFILPSLWASHKFFHWIAVPERTRMLLQVDPTASINFKWIFAKGFDSLLSHWHKYVNKGGDYVEKFVVFMQCHSDNWYLTFGTTLVVLKYPR
jgi:hypothetical protein